ncbi:MAG: DUF3429 domain-containing protein [Burkholderiaceae bacterium]|jgi:hypothetical protein
MNTATLSPVLEPLEPSPMAWRLGYAGLIPFVVGALLVWLVTGEAHPYVAAALSAYGAVIVSFLGGIHWGHVMRQWPQAEAGPAWADATLVWGVMPSLVAWLGVLMPPYAGLFVLGLAIIGCYLVDRRRYAALGLQAWMTLRFRLTAVASLCCFLGAAGS